MALDIIYRQIQQNVRMQGMDIGIDELSSVLRGQVGYASNPRDDSTKVFELVFVTSQPVLLDFISYKTPGPLYDLLYTQPDMYMSGDLIVDSIDIFKRGTR